jgi:hypothetical protein
MRVDTSVEIEAQIADRLRSLPPGRLREQVVRLFGRVIDFANECRCDDAQGDGVPCGSVLTACDGCPRCLAILSEVEARIPR